MPSRASSFPLLVLVLAFAGLATAQDPRTAEAHYRLATIAEKAGDLAGARREYEEAPGRDR